MNDLLSQQEKAKIEYFFKKIFSSYVYVSINLSILTIKTQKEIQFVNSYILENTVKQPISHDLLKFHFYSFVTIFFKLQSPQAK